MIALVIIAVAVTALFTVFTGPMARSADPMIVAQARAIASAYMDEIQMRDYGECDSEDVEREDYEEIGCYHDLDEPPHNQLGQAIQELDDYTVSVQVLLDDPETDVATITVNVTHASDIVDFDLNSYRGNY